MNRKKVKLFAIILSVVMASVSLSGCSSSSKKDTAKSSGEKPTIRYALMANPEELPSGAVQALQDKISKKDNVNFKIQVISKNTYVDKINVAVASGDFPEIIDYSAVKNIGKAVDSKFIVPITDIYKNDPNWSKVDKSIADIGKYKGEYYLLKGRIEYPDTVYYRKDWFDKLNLKTPTNPEEMYNVMKAFAKNDPDGNGKNDTYGITFDPTMEFTTPLWGMYLPTNPLDKTYGFYLDKSDNKVKSVYNLKDDFLSAVGWLKKAYSEGVLDKQFAVIKKDQVENNFLTGKTGTWIKGAQWIAPRYEKIKKNNPSADIISFPAMKGKYGYNYKSIPGGSGLFLTRSIGNNKEAGMKVIADIYGPDCILEKNLGKQGTDWDMKDGKLTFTKADDAAKYNPGEILASVFKVKLPQAVPVLEKNIDVTKSYDTLSNINTWLSQSATETSKGPDINKYAQETITKMIIGEVDPATYYDTFISQLNGFGLNKICDELTELSKSAK